MRHRFGPGKENPAYRHGGKGTRLYRIWKDMRTRCNNPRCKDYKNYGGRGIRVCRRWDKFENFAADMGPHPGAGWTLDRVDNDGNYAASNCEWATKWEQNNNRRPRRVYPPRGPNGWISL